MTEAKATHTFFMFHFFIHLKAEMKLRGESQQQHVVTNQFHCFLDMFNTCQRSKVPVKFSTAHPKIHLFWNHNCHMLWHVLLEQDVWTSFIENDNEAKPQAKAYSLANIKSYNFKRLKLWLKAIPPHVMLYYVTELIWPSTNYHNQNPKVE